MQEISRSFGSRLKALRKKAGLTQEEFAENVGVNYVTVSKWENGEYTPNTFRLKRIAEVLNCSEQDLLNDSMPDNSGWCLSIKIKQDFNEEVIDLSKGVPRISSITTTPTGGLLTLGGDYSIWTNDNQFKKLQADLKKYRAIVIQNGIALGGIKNE